VYSTVPSIPGTIGNTRASTSSAVFSLLNLTPFISLSQRHKKTAASTLRTMATDDSARDHKPFRFFDLPREIRDLVYSFVPVKHSLPFDFHRRHPEYRISGNCGIETLLVSRQFKIEIEKEAYLHTEITVSSGHDGTLSNGLEGPMKAPKSLEQLQNHKKGFERLRNLTLRLRLRHHDLYGKDIFDGMLSHPTSEFCHILTAVCRHRTHSAGRIPNSIGQHPALGTDVACTAGTRLLRVREHARS